MKNEPKKKRLPRGIHKLADGRYSLYATRRGRPVRVVVSWELLSKLKVPVEATRLKSPGLELARLALVKMQSNLLEERRTGVVDASGKVRIADLLPLMEADYNHQNYKSWRDVKHRWKHHLRASFGDILAAELTTDMLNLYIAKRQREDAERATVNRELSVLRRLLRLGHADGKVLTLPRFPHLKEINIRQGFLLQSEYNLLISHADCVGVRGLLTVGYSYGFRKGELLALRVRQIDLASGTIELERKQTKNGEVKVVCMTAEVKSVLALCVQDKQPDDAVFTWPHGGPIKDFRESWRSLFGAAELPLKLFHDLRRSAVRNMIMRGVDRDTAMKISGHRTMSVFSRYNIVNLDNLKDAARKIAEGAIATDIKTDNSIDEQPKAQGTIQ